MISSIICARILHRKSCFARRAENLCLPQVRHRRLIQSDVVLIFKIVVDKVQRQLALMIVVEITGWLQIAFLAATGRHVVGLARDSLWVALVVRLIVLASMLTILLRSLFLGCVVIKLLSEVLKHLLKVKLRLLLHLSHEDVPCMSDLLLASLEILTILRVEQLGIPAFDLFVVLQESLVVYQVFECLANLFQIDGLISLNLCVDLALGLEHIRLEQLHSVNVLFAARSRRSKRLS